VVPNPRGWYRGACVSCGIVLGGFGKKNWG